MNKILIGNGKIIKMEVKRGLTVLNSVAMILVLVASLVALSFIDEFTGKTVRKVAENTYQMNVGDSIDGVTLINIASNGAVAVVLKDINGGRVVINLKNTKVVNGIEITNIYARYYNRYFPSKSYARLKIVPSKNITTKSFNINNCMNIISQGSYILRRNLIVNLSVGRCISVDSINNVNINCDGNSINGGSFASSYADLGIPDTSNSPLIYIKNSKNFSISNCLINNNLINPNTDLIIVKDSSDGLIKNNIFNNGEISLRIYNSRNIKIINNNLSVLSADQSYGLFINMNNLIFQNPKNISTPGNLVLINGGDNIVSNNFIDGKKIPCCTLIINACCGTEPGSAKYKGADDGIIMGNNEKNDLIINNKIINAWDCGIETEGLVSNSIIKNNILIGNDFCGIGGWYNMGLINNTFEQNIIINSRSGFKFYYENIPTLPGYTGTIFFTNNTFNNNLGVNVTENGFGIACVNYPSCTGFNNEPLVVGNNKFNLNNFTLYFGYTVNIEVDGKYIPVTQVPAYVTCYPNDIITGSNNYCRDLIDTHKCSQIGGCKSY